MKHIRDYEKFNEEFLGSLLNAAKGAFKNFLTGISAPFKTLGDDFKKGLEKEELKKKVTSTLDSLLKTTTDSINKAEDESALNQIVDQFKKEFDEKCAQIDKEIQSVKESNGNLLLESAVKDGMIMGRVLLGMVKQKATELKMEFDKRVAAAKDLASKKSVRISEIKALVDDFKKKVVDNKYLDEQVKKYKQENKIESVETDTKGILVLNWGDVEVEIKLPEEGGTTRYRIVKSNSIKLVIPKGKSLFCDISGEAKKGVKVKFEKLSIEGAGEGDFKIDGKDFYETGGLEKITLDGKEVDSYKFEGESKDEQEDLVKKLGELKAKKPDEIKRVSSFVDFVSKDENKPKLVEIEKIMNTES